MIHRLILFRLLIVLGSLTAASTPGEATAQVNTPASGQDSRIPPGVRVQIRDRAALQAGKLANLPSRTRRGIILDYVLNAFAQAADLPGFDTELLNPTERQEAQQIVDQLFSPAPAPGPAPQPAPPHPPPRRHRGRHRSPAPPLTRPRAAARSRARTRPTAGVDRLLHRPAAIPDPCAGQFVGPGPARRAHLPMGPRPGDDHDGEASRAPKAMASLVTVSLASRPQEDASGASDWTGPPGRLCGMAFEARWPTLLIPTSAIRPLSSAGKAVIGPPETNRMPSADA